MFSDAIRSAFLAYFQSKGHRVCPASSLIPYNDPSLLFTTAGMVQFKDIFTGREKRPYPSAVTVQKCVRAGGKHNDLEQVGHTARHHTFFEMLGNFSFGDYFKEQAILYAWDFLTREVGLSQDRLWITVYHTDEEAYNLWAKIAQPEHILRIATQDNFWSAGDTGPCGPCSEIFYDHGPHLKGGLPGSSESDGDRFVELWNLVFMQFNQMGPEERQLLSEPSIDTGMGLERFACVLQGVSNNFETDILRALVEQSFALSRKIIDESGHDLPLISHRVIADHVRSSSFLIADGVLPSNEGRGYVLRRIIRRALRHVHYIKAAPSHLSALVPLLVEKMGGFYPELLHGSALVQSVLCQEGERFQELLDHGLALIEEWLSYPYGGNVFPGSKAFQLYDTYGFPLDLTQDIVKEQGLTVDEKEFYQYMEQQKEQSRQSWVGSGAAVRNHEWMKLSPSLLETQFTGYTEEESLGTLHTLLQGQVLVETLSCQQEGIILSDITPFYGESGGQVGDQGIITGPEGVFEVKETHKHGTIILHHGVVREGTFRRGHPLRLCVASKRREKINIHHSATHLLQSALRSVLGSHVTQKGSLVNTDKLRFDFSHHRALSWEEIQHVEAQVNESIRCNLLVSMCHMDQKKALQEGAMAFFGEKYEEQVRVLTMGSVSKELCGGTHVESTGKIGLFKIIHEVSVASGIRRIEAVAGEAALLFVQQMHKQIKNLSAQLKTAPWQLEEKIEQLLQKKSMPDPKAKEVPTMKEKIGPICFWHAHIQDMRPKDLKEWMDQLKQQIGSGIIALSTTMANKVTALVGVTQDLTPTWDASDLLTTALQEDGSGGGRADLAQGGNTCGDPSVFIGRLKKAIETNPLTY